MSNVLKKHLVALTAATIAATGCAPSYGYGLYHKKPRHTTEKENSFVEKQGYKEPTYRNDYKRWLHRKHLKLRKRKGHKYGGAKK